MKRLVLWATLILSFGCITPNSTVRDELMELQRYVPMDRIQMLFGEYFVYDPEFRRTVQYLRSKDFSDIWTRFLEVETVIELMSYMAAAGLPINEALDLFADFTGMVRPNRMFRRFAVIKQGGLSSFIGDVVKIVSTSDVVKVSEAKKHSSPQYKEMTEKMVAPAFKQLFKQAIEDLKVTILQERMREYGINLPEVLDLLKALFGWSSVF